MAIGRVLVIAGSDSSGGAGIEADQKVIAAHGCYAQTATTALTIQTTREVRQIHAVPAEFVRGLIDAGFEDVGVDVVKVGMLASAETVGVVADALRRHDVPLLVVDPVMVSTSGDRLLPEDAVRTLCEELIPLATVLTPNLPEAMLILREAGRDSTPPLDPPQSVNDFIKIAKSLSELGPRFILLKGGHQPLTKDGRVSTQDAESRKVIDILYARDGGATTVIETDYLDSKDTHGTGCSLASAVASNLALQRQVQLELDVVTAVRQACRYVEAGIKFSPGLGKGHGPINHFHSMQTLPFARGRFVEYLLDRVDVRDVWKTHTEHEFVRGIAGGTLPMERFREYLVQDYLYLVHFARANALAAYKAKNMEDIAASAEIVLHINREMSLHLDYCKEMGLSKQDVESQPENQACIAYTRYLLDIGHSEDLFALQIAFAPCLLGYGIIARRLYDDPATRREGNPYFKWIENYVAEDYTQAVRLGSDLLEREAVRQSPARIEELVKIFVQATRMETGFWDMGHGLR